MLPYGLDETCPMPTLAAYAGALLRSLPAIWSWPGSTAKRRGAHDVARG
jgi:hypothetical protein